jgi:hypothetical protein
MMSVAKMEHPHPTNCRQSKQIIMFYQKKSKSTITNDKRTSISNPNKTQIRILLVFNGLTKERKFITVFIALDLSVGVF